MPTKIKVFIAEDEEPVLLSLKKLLIFSGFLVEGTPKAKEVFGMVKVFKPDVVLLDLRMPEMDGFQICQQLRSDQETQAIPIFILSAFAGEEEIKKAQNFGVKGYFSKPYDYLKLVAAIKKTIEDKQ